MSETQQTTQTPQPRVPLPSDITTVPQALDVLVQAAQLGCKRGAYTLEEAALINQARLVITETARANAQKNSPVAVPQAGPREI